MRRFAELGDVYISDNVKSLKCQSTVELLGAPRANANDSTGQQNGLALC